MGAHSRIHSLGPESILLCDSVQGLASIHVKICICHDNANSFLVFSLNQSCGSGFIESGYGSSISSDPIRIQGFDDQKPKKEKYSREMFFFFFW